MLRSRRFPAVALGVGGVLLIAAVAWLVVAVPALVKYPTDLDVTARYEGTFTLLVDPTTTAPLAQPLSLPLTVERHLQADPDQSTSSQVLVRETITQKAGSILNLTQNNAYVMDRSTVLNVKDDRAFAFQPTNVVDRAGMYRLNLPFGTSADDYMLIYNNDIGMGYRLNADTATPTSEIEGLSVLNFNGAMTDTAVTDPYLAELRQAAPLPATMTLDQMKPHLLAAGVDVDALLTALGPRLSPGDAATLASVAADPIPLQYVESFTGKVAAEPTTGAQVRVGTSEALGVRPQPAMTTELRAVLGRYPDVPEAVAADAALQRLTTDSAIRVFDVRYDQTPASVADVAGQVSSQRRQIQLVKVAIPLVLAVAGLVALALGVIALLRRRQTTPLDLTTLPEHRETRPKSPSLPALDAEELSTPGYDNR